MPDVFCALCGVVLSNYEDPSPPSARLPWVSETRGVVRLHTIEAVRLSGVGLVSPGRFRASFEPPLSYIDHFDDLNVYRLRRLPGLAIYLFHDACWQLLVSRLSCEREGGSGVDAESIALALLHFCRCLPADGQGALLVSHDYGGAERFRRAYGFGSADYEGSLPEEWLFLTADPGDSITEQTIASLPGLASSLPEDIGHYVRPSRTDPFRNLPFELIELIITKVASPDLYNLRLASRAVASISSPSSLSQLFWESRFTSDSEMGFFFPGLPPRSHAKNLNWRALFALIRKSLGGGALSAGLRNRRRIWSCLDHVICFLQPLLHASNRDWLIDGASSVADSLLENHRVVAAAQSHAKYHHAAQYLPFRDSPGASRLYIAIFFIEYNCRRYVSGVALRCRNGDKFTTLHHLGISTSTEERHELDDLKAIGGIKVYSAASGIVGLEFYLLGRGSEDISFGLCSSSGCDIAVTELLLARDGVFTGVIFTFDACKCTGVQLVESALVSQGCQSTPTANEDPTASEPPMSILWKLSIPTEDDVVPLSASDQSPYPSVFSRCSPVRLNMDFGGHDGGKLRLLNRIVALLDVPDGLFRGFNFFYDDGTSACYGTRLSAGSLSPEPCLEKTFAVCGKGGERVTEIQAIGGGVQRREHIQGLVFSTNWGSTSLFVAQRGFEAWSQEQLDADPSTDDMSLPFATFRPTEGNVLTGLVAELTDVDRAPDFNGIVGALATVSAPISRANQGTEICPSPQMTTPVPGGNFQVAQHMVRREKTCLTSTSLKDVRRILFSAGVAGRTRSSEFLSGLNLQFYNSERENFVGQWFQEVDVMDVDHGDYITHIRVWYTQEARKPNPRRENKGKIVGVTLSTFKGAVKTVLRAGPEGMVFYDYYTNPREHIASTPEPRLLGVEPYGLVWSFSPTSDFMEVLRSAGPEGDGKPLRFENTSPLVPRSVHDVRRFLWMELDRDGNEVPLTSIAAFFDAEKRLTGLKFVYGAHTETAMGVCLGERVAVVLPPSETPVCMDVDVCSDSGGDLFVIHTDRGRRLFLGHPGTRIAGLEDRTRYILTPSVVPPLPADGVTPGIPVHEWCPTTTDKCVGIWALAHTFPRATPGIFSLGPVFVQGGDPA